MVFDVSAHGKTFTERMALSQGLAKHIDQPWVQAVAQNKTHSHAALKTLLQTTVQAGGEGLMLHRGNSLYPSGRNGDVLKVKLHEDAEATVVG
jgi:DNA ligase-1